MIMIIKNNKKDNYKFIIFKAILVLSLYILFIIR